MKKTTIFTLLLVFGQFVHAQHLEWAQMIGDDPIADNATIQLTPSDQIVLSNYGETYPTYQGLDIDPTSSSYLIYPQTLVSYFQRYGSTGQFESLWHLSDTAYNTSYDRKELGSNSTFMSGIFHGSINFDPNSTNQTLYGPPTDVNPFYLKLDAQGDFEWVKTMSADAVTGSFEGLADDGTHYCGMIAKGLIKPNPNDTTVSYNSGSEYVFVVTALDASGGFEWSAYFKSTSQLSNPSVRMHVGADGSVYLYGEKHYGFVLEGTNITSPYQQSDTNLFNKFLLKINSDGTYGWSKLVNDNLFMRDAKTIGDKLILFGKFAASPDFDLGSGVVTSSASEGAFFLRLNASDGSYVNHIELDEYSESPLFDHQMEDGPMFLRYSIPDGTTKQVGLIGNTTAITGQALHLIEILPDLSVGNTFHLNTYGSLVATSWAIGADYAYHEVGIFCEEHDFDLGSGTMTLDPNEGDSCKSYLFKLDMMTPAGIEAFDDESRISLYPNPNNGTFQLQLEGASAKSITAMDLLGREVPLSYSLNGSNTSVQLQAKPGTYLVRIARHDGEPLVKRVVVR